MPSAKNVNSLVGAATRFIASRNAVQTVYWRSSSGPNGTRMIKYNKTCKFDKSEKVPLNMQSRFMNADILSKPKFVQEFA